MAANPNKAMVRRLYDEVFSKGILATADELLAADYVGYDPPQVPIPLGYGPQSMKDGAALLRSAFPDCHFNREKLIAEGDMVAAQVAMRGRHTGAFMDILPTNQSVTIRGMVIYRFSLGKIVESHGLWDMLGLLRRLGALSDGLEATNQR